MPTEAGAGPQRNRILAALPADEFSRLADDLERVSFPVGATLYTSGESLAFAYFPTTCIFSLIATAEDGSTIEVAMTGRNGMVGIALVLGGETTPTGSSCSARARPTACGPRCCAGSSTRAAACAGWP